MEIVYLEWWWIFKEWDANLFAYLWPSCALLYESYYFAAFVGYSFSSNLSNLIFRGGINWSVCRSNSLGTINSTHRPVHASPRNRRKLDLRGLRRMNWTTAALHCTVLHSTILYCTTLYYTVLYYTLLYCTVLHSAIYRCALCHDIYFY